MGEDGIRRGYIEEVIRAEEERAWGNRNVPENEKEISAVDKCLKVINDEKKKKTRKRKEKIT